MSIGDACASPRSFDGTVDRHADRAFDVRLPLPQRLDVDAERGGDFGVVGLAAELRRERRARGADVARLAAHGARHVILATQLVEDRAADARHGERAEREAALGIERVHGRHQAERAGADQLVVIELVAQLALELARDVMHEAQVLGEERVSGGQVAFGEGFPMGSGFHGLAPASGCGRAGNGGHRVGTRSVGHDGMKREMTPRTASAAGDPSSASCTVMPAPTAASRHGSSGTAPATSIVRPRKCEHAPTRNSHASAATASPWRFDDHAHDRVRRRRALTVFTSA